MTMDEAEFQDPKMRALSERFDFTPGDLAANRQGRLSDRQLANYRQSATRVQYVAAGIGLLVGLMYGYSAAAYSAPPLDITNGLIVGIGGFLVIFLSAMWLRWFIFRRPLRSGNVKTVTGLVGFGWARRGRIVWVGKGLKGRHWHEEVGDRSLFGDIHSATLYYLQGVGTTKVHSIEPAALESGRDAAH